MAINFPDAAFKRAVNKLLNQTEVEDGGARMSELGKQQKARAREIAGIHHVVACKRPEISLEQAKDLLHDLWGIFNEVEARLLDTPDEVRQILSVVRRGRTSIDAVLRGK